MDTTTQAPEPGQRVLMDGMLWTVEAPLPHGIYRLSLVHPVVDWPAGQVGFGHHSRLTVPEE